MALEFNAEAVNEAKDEAAKLLNVLTADIVTIAKNSPGRFPARGSPGNNAPVQSGIYQRGIRIDEIASRDSLVASMGVFGVNYARDIEETGAYGRAWRGRNNIRDAVNIAIARSPFGA